MKGRGFLWSISSSLGGEGGLDSGEEGGREENPQAEWNPEEKNREVWVAMWSVWSVLNFRGGTLKESSGTMLLPHLSLLGLPFISTIKYFCEMKIYVLL